MGRSAKRGKQGKRLGKWVHLKEEGLHFLARGHGHDCRSARRAARGVAGVDLVMEVGASIPERGQPEEARRGHPGITINERSGSRRFRPRALQGVAQGARHEPQGGGEGTGRQSRLDLSVGVGQDDAACRDSGEDAAGDRGEGPCGTLGHQLEGFFTGISVGWGSGCRDRGGWARSCGLNREEGPRARGCDQRRSTTTRRVPVARTRFPLRGPASLRSAPSETSGRA